MKQKWHFINSGKSTPAFNMALDEALLQWHSQGEIGPTVRFYGWNPATLSIGYFQKVQKEICLEAVRRYQLGFVRRPTGGRGVLHEHELTYSVIVSETHPKIPKGVTESYRVISEGVLEGFKQLGLDAYFSTPKSKLDQDKLKRPSSAVCFDAPSWYELVVEGRKVAGSAQMRQKNVILQHGSIILDMNRVKLFDLFKFPNERVRERMLSTFTEKAVTINELSKRQITIKEAEMAFKRGFEKGLAIELETYTLSDQKKAFVDELAVSRYGNDEWNFCK